MKKIIILSMIAGMLSIAGGCKKEETPGSKLDSMIKSGEKAAKDAKKEAGKASAEVEKKLDAALNQ